MLQYLKKEANCAKTENGAATYATTGSDCLDLFATIGALRHESDDEIVRRFVRAYTEDADLAMKLLFFARDIRGGLGERRVFRTILAWLAKNEPAAVRKNLKYIGEYGRFDDLLVLFDTPCEPDMLEFIRCRLQADLAKLPDGPNRTTGIPDKAYDAESKPPGESVSLLAKWLPSVNASNRQTVRYAKRIARFLGMDDATYRKTLVMLRAQIQILENHLREKDYSFDYSKQPSRAMFKYRRAFLRNDPTRYSDFLSRVSAGEETLHADTLYPYDLVAPFVYDPWLNPQPEIGPEEQAVLNATWNSLPDYGGEDDTLAIIDNSGSMYYYAKPSPAAVALSLGLYFAEHNRGAFRNHFITFSTRPQLIALRGDTFVERLRYLMTFSEVADTNLEAVFHLILRTAVKNGLAQDDLPARLLIISDMEFNTCVTAAGETNFRHARQQFAAHGYRLPEIVFWNVASRNRQQPVTKNEQGVILVSGATPKLFEMVAGGTPNPYLFMLETLGSERYAPIAS